MKLLLTSILTFLSISLWASGLGPGVTPEEAQEKLIKGNQRFASESSQHLHQDMYRRVDTAINGQHPYATIIGCSDSRVPIEIIFDQGVGDIFVIRVAGNVVDTDEAGSIEYGVDHLQTPLFVVLGHKSCGACTAVVTGAELHGNIPELVDNIIPAKETVIESDPNLTGDELIAAVIKQNVWTSIEDLIKKSPISALRIQSNQLKVVGAIYDLETGLVEWIGEHPNQDELLIENIYPDWNPATTYTGGETVYYHGSNYTAKWWSNNEEPGHSNVWEKN